MWEENEDPAKETEKYQQEHWSEKQIRKREGNYFHSLLSSSLVLVLLLLYFSYNIYNSQKEYVNSQPI